MHRAPPTPTLQVSRERVGCELDQMVRSAAPLRAFQLMDDMNLLPIVFPLPEGFDLPMDDDHTRAYEFGMVYLKVQSTNRNEENGAQRMYLRLHPRIFSQIMSVLASNQQTAFRCRGILLCIMCCVTCLTCRVLLCVPATVVKARLTPSFLLTPDVFSRECTVRRPKLRIWLGNMHAV